MAVAPSEVLVCRRGRVLSRRPGLQPPHLPALGGDDVAGEHAGLFLLAYRLALLDACHLHDLPPPHRF